MTLDDLVLHPRTREMINKILNKMPHALIVEGVDGIGVSATAQAIAKHFTNHEFMILPKKKQKTEFVVDMEEGSVVIDDIRQLYTQTRVVQDTKQVFVIDTGAKSMTTGAQNAFLKLLEEPRDDTHFIIATHHADQLLPTIASRCQKLSLLPATDAQTQNLINQLGVLDSTKQTRLAFVGRGKPALIKRLVSDDEQYDARVRIMKDAKTMISGTNYEKLVTINNYRDKRADSLTLIDDMNYQLKTVLKSQPDGSIASTIARNLDIQSRISGGGNIRLQLMNGMLK